MHRDPCICTTVRDGRQRNSELPWPNSYTLKDNFVVNIGILLKKQNRIYSDKSFFFGSINVPLKTVFTNRNYKSV